MKTRAYRNSTARIYVAALSLALRIVPLLNWLGGPNVIIGAGVVLAVSAIVWAESRLRPQKRRADCVSSVRIDCSQSLRTID